MSFADNILSTLKISLSKLISKSRMLRRSDMSVENSVYPLTAPT
jgi:hypothetical protein